MTDVLVYCKEHKLDEILSFALMLIKSNFVIESEPIPSLSIDGNGDADGISIIVSALGTPSKLLASEIAFCKEFVNGSPSNLHEFISLNIITN